MEMPKEFFDKRMDEIDSHDFCIALLRQHQEMKVPGNVSLEAGEPGYVACFFIHYDGGSAMIDATTARLAQSVWEEYTSVLRRVKNEL